MSSLFTVLSLAAFAGLTQAHGVLLNAQGIDGSPNSVGFQGKLRDRAPAGVPYVEESQETSLLTSSS